MTEFEFQTAYRDHKDVVYRFACRMTGSRELAEEIVQEAFLAVWGRHSFDEKRGSLRAYLLGVARHQAFQWFRKEYPRENIPENLASPAINVIDRLVVESRERLVEQAVYELPPLQREVVILAEYEELTMQEIADAVGADVPAVKSRLHRARCQLREKLQALLPAEKVLSGTRRR